MPCRIYKRGQCEYECLYGRRGLTDWRDSLFVAQTGEPDSSDKSNTTQWEHAHTKFCSSLHKLLYVCVLAEADSDVPLCSAASWRRSKRRKKKKKDETFHPIYSNTARHRKALTSTCRCRQDLEVGVECGGGVCPHDCLQNWSRCTFSLLAYFSTSVSVCVQVSSLALVFYLHVNRTRPQRMSTHNIANPALKNNHFVFVSSSGSFPLQPGCFSHTPAALPPFLFIQQLSTALILPAAQERCSANLGRT